MQYSKFKTRSGKEAEDEKLNKHSTEENYNYKKIEKNSKKWWYRGVGGGHQCSWREQGRRI